MAAPPPHAARLGRSALAQQPRTTSLTDLPLDCLALIFSMVGLPRSVLEQPRFKHSSDELNLLSFIFKARFKAAPLVCKDLAAAAARPSVAWNDVSFYGYGTSRAAWSSFFAALQRAATSVRRLSMSGFKGDADFQSELVTALQAVAPYVEWLWLGNTEESLLRCAQALGAVPSPLRFATRLVELRLGYIIFTGPPGMLASAFEAIAACRPAPGYPRWTFHDGEASLAARLHRAITVAAAAAGRPVRLVGLGGVNLGPPPGQGGAADVDLDAVAALGGDSSVALDVEFEMGWDGTARERRDAFQARLATLVDRLPALRDLNLYVYNVSEPMAFHLPAVRLSRLALDVDLHGGMAEMNAADTKEPPDVLLPPTLAASLQVLRMNVYRGYPEFPPECVAGGALTRLTRLEYGGYGGKYSSLPHDLAAWGNATHYRLPALRVMTVWAEGGFTLDGQRGRLGPCQRDWPAGVVATLPRLERLTLASHEYSFACWGVYTASQPACKHCWEYKHERCIKVRNVRRVITVDLPAAFASAGRRLALEFSKELPWLSEWRSSQKKAMRYAPAPR